MSVSAIKNIFEVSSSQLAFIIGNGINRFNIPSMNSWDALLLQLWNELFQDTLEQLPTGIALTEIYDLLSMQLFKLEKKLTLQQKFADLLKDWNYFSHHTTILTKIQQINAPVLTTNFDNVLAQTIQAQLFKLEDPHFTDFYPWSSYFAQDVLMHPCQGFAIWPIHGTVYYARSLRLGLSHYMGSVERARRMIYQGKPKTLYNKDHYQIWQGCNTWLDIIFHKALFIFGLGLEASEVFLRWLLIERAKYYDKYPKRQQPGWYISGNPEEYNPAKILLLKKLGIEYIQLDNYHQLYQDIW